MNHLFIKSYEVVADVAGNLIARFSDAAASSKVAIATASDQPIIGIIDSMGGRAGGQTDVHRLGVAPLRLGGAVEAGDPLTSDDEGRGIKAEPEEGETIRIVGYAEAPGEEDDIIDCFVAVGLLHEPAGG